MSYIMHFLQIITLVENVLGIYRNHLLFKNITRILIYLRIIFEILLIILNLVNYTINVKSDISYLFLFHLNAANSIVLLLLPIYKAVPYKQFLVYFKSIFLYFPTQREQTKITKNIQKVLLLTVLSYLLLKLVFHLYYLPLNDAHYPFILMLILTVDIFTYEMRFLFEFYIMCCGSSAMADQLAVIMEAIAMETEKVNSVCEHGSNSNSQDCERRLLQIDKWSTAYATTKKFSELYNSIFGFQVNTRIKG